MLSAAVLAKRGLRDWPAALDDADQDNDANHRLYGNDASAAKIITESEVSAPPSAHELIAALQKSSPQLKR